MRFPKEKMKVTPSFEGRESEHGWLEIDIARIDIDGLNKLYVNLDDVETLRREVHLEKDALARAKELLGG